MIRESWLTRIRHEKVCSRDSKCLGYRGEAICPDSPLISTCKSEIKLFNTRMLASYKIFLKKVLP